MIKKSLSLFFIVTMALISFVLMSPNVYASKVVDVESQPVEYFDYVSEGEKTFLSIDDYPSQYKRESEVDEDNYIVEPYSWWQYVYDQYEYNDDFYRATYINTLGNISFNKTIYGTLHQYPFWYVTEWGDMKDVDFYRIVLTADSEFRVSLSNIPSGRNYELELYKLDDSKLKSGSGSVQILMKEAYDLIGESKNGSNISEYISVVAQAGEYVVKVYSVSGTSDHDFYRLNFQSLPNSYHPIQTISFNDLKNQGHKMAIWQSDFYPLGKSTLELQEDGDIGPYWKNADYVGDSSVNATIYQKLKEVEPTQLLQSAVYVWDPEIKAELRELYAGIYNSLNQIKTQGYNNVSILIEITSIGTGAASLAVTFSFHPAVGFTLGAYSLISSLIVNYVMPIEIEVNIDEALPYYAAYMNALEVGPNSNPNEIVCIRNYYRISEYQKNWYSEKRLIVDTTPRYYGTNSKVDENGSISWRGPLNSDGEYDQLFAGQIYGISTIEEMNHIIESTKKHVGPLVMPSIHEHSFHYTGSLDHHYLICECGEISSMCSLTPTVSNYNSDYHIYRCHGFQKLELHEKYFDGTSYRCSTSGCNWTQTVLKNHINTENYGYESQYFFDERIKDITTEDGINVTTKRLRTGIIENKLVMSAKRNNAGTAYMEYHFNHNISRVDYELALWSDNESLILNSSIRFEALNSNGIWVPLREFDAKTMSQNKDYLISYHTEIDFQSRAFRFIIETNQVQNENNRGRVVIGDVTVIRHHTHTYHSPYIAIGDAGHLATCSCGDTILQAHISGLHEPGDRYANCIRCNYLIDLWNGGPIIVIPNHNHDHESECTHEKHYDEDLDDVCVMIDVCCNNMIAIVQKEEELYEN